MTTFIHLAVLFVTKMLDNALGTAKTILVQRNRCLLACIALILSDYIYFSITKKIVTADSNLAIVVVSLASGVGCWLAMTLNNRLSKERTFVNVIMSDDKNAMQELRDFLARHHITNVAADSYTLDWSTKTITITAYAETKEQSLLIDRYIQDSPPKFKRMVQRI